MLPMIWPDRAVTHLVQNLQPIVEFLDVCRSSSFLVQRVAVVAHGLFANGLVHSQRQLHVEANVGIPPKQEMNFGHGVGIRGRCCDGLLLFELALVVPFLGHLLPQK